MKSEFLELSETRDFC